MSPLPPALRDDFMPLVGELAWHSLTVDPRIPAESAAHLAEVERVLDTYPPPGEPIQLLEVGAYAHTTGYSLSELRGSRVTLFDISASTLRLGRDLAVDIPAEVRRVAGDFHRLPFEDESFDAVMVRSTLHHTWRWQKVVSELLRVLNHEGVLFFENEPCHRSCCLYGFRTNRPELFTRFEQQLDELGVLRTFGEPFYGSRPETLFGMIENQTIPVTELLDAITQQADLVETVVVPEQTMGDLEHAWLQHAHLSTEALTDRIVGDLTQARDAAQPDLGSAEIGLGFALPNDDEIQDLAARVADELRALPTPSAEIDFRSGLAAIYGAAVRLVARKRGPRQHPSLGRLSGTFDEVDGVLHGFFDQTASLATTRSTLPDIQRDVGESLEGAFPATEWQRVVDGDVAMLHLCTSRGTIHLPPGDSERLLVMRYRCVHSTDCPSTITLSLDGNELYRQESWLSETYLCVARIPPTRSASPLFVESRADNAASGPQANIVVYLASLVPLPA